MEYGKIYLTEEGKKLAVKTLHLKTLKFLHFKVGDGEIENIESIQGLTDLVNPVLDFNVTKISTENDTQAEIKGVFSNINILNYFYLRELGLYAEDPDTSEIVLFAYVNFGNKAEFVAKGDIERKEIYYDLIVSVGNSNCVEIKINSETIYATEKDLEDTKEEIQEELDKKVEVVEKGTNTNGSYIKYSNGTMKCWKKLKVEAGGTLWNNNIYYSDHNMGKWAQEFKSLVTSRTTVFSKQFWSTQVNQTCTSAGEVRCFRPTSAISEVIILIEAWGYYTVNGQDLIVIDGFGIY